MSLLLTLYVPEGIIIAGDSRLTLSWSHKLGEEQMFHSITASDSNNKVFVIKNKFGLGTFNAADINGIPISGFINQFIEEKITDETEIDEIPALLHDFFLYDWHIEKQNRQNEKRHAFKHSAIALKNANLHFDLNQIERDIISKHMWPVTKSLPRYTESLIVSIIDKYCAILETYDICIWQRPI